MNNFKFLNNHPLLKDELHEIYSLMHKMFSQADPLLKSTLIQTLHKQSVFLRPSLVLLSAKAVDPHVFNNKLIKIAASVELLHLTRLIHDQVTDNQYKDVDVYAGDFLFTQFFELILNAIPDQNYLAKNAKTIHQIVESKLNNQTSPTLFRLACEEGARFNGANFETISLLAEFGEAFGNAYLHKNLLSLQTALDKLTRLPVNPAREVLSRLTKNLLNT